MTTAKLCDIADRLSRKLNVEVEPDYYDVGYWLRVAGEECPANGGIRMQTGWGQADKELREESSQRIHRWPGSLA
jgi:hypothetical protein